MMNGIDISSWQTGINLEVVPCDFVIVKATEGTNYVNPDCNRAFQQGLALGKKMGLYHFASGTNAISEADYFVNNISNYIGKAILVLDWEADAVTRGVAWAKQWLDRVYQKTGVKPLLYSYNNCVNSYDWSSVANADYGLWNAGYYNYGTQMGYNPQSPLLGGTGAWKQAAIYQYTSEGKLNGWNGNLDLNVAYMNAVTWDKYAKTPVRAEDKIWYRGHVENMGWQDATHDGATCGTTGKGKRLEAIKIDTRKMPGVKIFATAHIQDVGDVDYGQIDHNTVIGTTGKKRRIESIKLRAEGLPAGDRLLIRVHIQGIGWTDWISGEIGTKGMRRAIEAIQIKIG